MLGSQGHGTLWHPPYLCANNCGGLPLSTFLPKHFGKGRAEAPQQQRGVVTRAELQKQQKVEGHGWKGNGRAPMGGHHWPPNTPPLDQFLHDPSPSRLRRFSLRHSRMPQREASDCSSFTERTAICCAKKKSSKADVSVDDSEPWVGAVVFSPVGNQRSYSFVTTLERLGLADLSSNVSRREAAALVEGLLDSTKAAALVEHQLDSRSGETAALVEGPLDSRSGGGSGSGGGRGTPTPLETDAANRGGRGTPALIKMDVASRGRDLSAVGSVETVLGLHCTRCLAPTPHRVQAEFQLLLTATPVVEPTMRSMGVVLGDRRWDKEDFTQTFLDNDDGVELSSGLLDLDLDDKIYFPVGQKSVDLSKYFRDTVHLELPLKLLCSSSCRGMCFSCGVNLNLAKCQCDPEEGGGGGSEDGEGGGSSPRGSLAEQIRSQLQRRRNR